MNAKLKKLVVILAITTVFLSFTDVSIKRTFSDDISGEIDLFTQKERYNGKGPNTPSDAFGLGDIVILYAFVTYNAIPSQNSLVTFHVESPDDASFDLAAETNASGIALVNFTVPKKCVNASDVFGEWFALAQVLLGGRVFQDTLTFNVNRIIKLISVRTIDENLTHRTSFGIGGEVGLEIALRSVSMCMKSTMLAIVIQDELNVPINHLEICDFEVPPNEKLVFLYCKLHIPKWAHVGTATIYVSALTAQINQSGVPYCPAISTDFSITLFEPLTLAFHDVAVINVTPSATSVESGQPLYVTAAVRNEGTEVDGFNVSVHLDDVLAGTLEVAALSPYFKATLNFTLDTSLFDVGNYTITVSIPCLTQEADVTDNTFIDGVIEIKPEVPTIIHDIAIIDVDVSNNSIYIGDLLEIYVSIVNKGTETETFNVNAYYDSLLIERIQVNTLEPAAQVTLVFIWKTNSVPAGFYKIAASAPVSDDVNIEDNFYVDGVVEVRVKYPPLLVHDVAVLSVLPNSTFVYVGGVVEVLVVVKNEGDFVESFNVTVFYDFEVVGRQFVENLESGVERTLVFQWDTQGVLEGNYTLKASASFVSEEADFKDNFYVDGVVEVRVKYPPLLVHDVAVLSVLPNSTFVYVGGVVEVLVVVKNEGDFVESFNVTVFYDFEVVGRQFVENLESGVERTLVFQWDTQGVLEGNYTLKALAHAVSGEQNLENNSCEDGIVTVVESPKRRYIPSWFYWLLLLMLLVILMAILLIAWYYRRKKRKRAEEAFNSGWTAWYYGYDLRAKAHTI